MEPRPDEGELLQRAQSGDLAAFNVLVQHYQSAVYNVCLRMLRVPQSAEDAAQEAFISAYKSLAGFRGGSFRSWLYRIAGNSCYDELRRLKARPALHLDQPDAEGEPRIDPPSLEPSLDEQAQQGELRRALQDALGQLPSDQRLAIILCDVQGLDYAEIAIAMDCSLGTVKSRINRARGKLRGLLLARGELLPDRFRQESEDK
jgi:RNA polymerase sigma-70 factor (ECF subfamily)